MTTDLLGSPPNSTRQRISNLLIKGKQVLLGSDNDGPVYVWVQALNSPQHEEAVRDGAMALARSRLSYQPGNPEYDALLGELDLADKDDLIAGIISTVRIADIWAKAQDDLHADEKWRDSGKLDLIERGDEAIKDGLKMSDDQLKSLAALNIEYQNDWRACAEIRVGLMKQELAGTPKNKLIDEYINAWVSMRTAREQIEEYETTSVYYAVRFCEARKEGDHSRCGNHTERWFDRRKDVRDGPDLLLQKSLEALRELDSAADVLGGEAPQPAQG